MVVLHRPRPGGVIVGESRGPRLRDYGSGRVCASGGCRVILRRSNPGPYCNLHEKELETFMKGLREEREAAVLDYLKEHPGWVSMATLSEALDIPKGSMAGAMSRLLKDKVIVARSRLEGGGYCCAGDPCLDELNDAADCDEGASSEGQKDAKAGADLTPGADAPDTSPGQDPAASAPAPSGDAPEAPAPSGAAEEEDRVQSTMDRVFAGMAADLLDDEEVRATAICVWALNHLDDDRAGRVAKVLTWKFPL